MAGPLVVQDAYRKNELSVIPGGSSITLHYEGTTLIYDKIKNPAAYLRKAFRNAKVKYATVDGRDIYRAAKC